MLKALFSAEGEAICSAWIKKSMNHNKRKIFCEHAQAQEGKAPNDSDPKHSLNTVCRSHIKGKCDFWSYCICLKNLCWKLNALLFRASFIESSQCTFIAWGCKHYRVAAGSDVNETCENPCLASKLWPGDNKGTGESNRLLWFRAWQMPPPLSLLWPLLPQLSNQALGGWRGGQPVFEPRSTAEGGLMEWMTLPHSKSDETEGGVVSISNEWGEC